MLRALKCWLVLTPGFRLVGGGLFHLSHGVKVAQERAASSGLPTAKCPLFSASSLGCLLAFLWGSVESQSNFSESVTRD